MSRLSDIDVDKLSADQRRVYDSIVAGPRGVVIGPHRVWLLSPAMCDRAQAFGEFCRYKSSLPPNLSELAIIIMGAYWKAGFEWFHHAPIAMKAGVDPKIVEDLRTGRTPVFTDAKEEALYRFSQELITNRRVSRVTYEHAVETLGQVPVVELVGILGYYTLICMSIVAFDIPADDGSNPFGDTY